MSQNLDQDEGVLGGFSQGGNDGGMRPVDVDASFRDFLALSRFPKAKQVGDPGASDYLSIDSNSAFWCAAHNAYEGQRVLLRSFVVTEWLPSAPGRFFTPEAAQRRRKAAGMWAPMGGEYLPLGKLQMILGGIGSVRLSAKQTDLGRRHFLGASKNGISHQGIPLSLSEDQYREIAPRLRGMGACLCDVIGTVQVVPHEVGAVAYDRGIPKYIIAVTDLEIDRKTPRAEVSVSIIYRGAALEHQIDRKDDTALGWSFIKFNPAKNLGPNGSLKQATDWLQQYAKRHSVIPDPPILCDFDEISEHFDMPVDFRIADLFRGDLDARIVEKYSRRYGVRFDIHQYGDVFSNISNSTIINRSRLS